MSRVEAGAVTIQAKVSSIFEVEAQGLCEMAFAGIIDSSIDEDAEVGEGSSVNDDELIEVPDFKGNECIEDVKVNPELSEKQKKEIREIFNKFQDVLTDKPGETSLIEHDSKLTSDQPVRTKQYPLPFSMTETIKAERKC